MKRFAVVFVVVLAGLAGACSKPSEESCRKAIANMRELLGTESISKGDNGDIRRCKGGSSKKAVECAINAKTRDELRACGFIKASEGSAAPAGSAAAPAPTPAAPAPAGSAAAPAPAPAPADPAAAPAGSAAAPAPAGSAAAPAGGAAGSAQ